MVRRRRAFWREEPVEIVMGMLAVLSLVMLVWEVFGSLSEVEVGRIRQIDIVIGLIFLIEFTIRWLSSSDRMKFFRSNWWLLLACIPISGDLAVALRIVRLERVLRVARIAGHLSYGGTHG